LFYWKNSDDSTFLAQAAGLRSYNAPAFYLLKKFPTDFFNHAKA
jgi:hypothetical protein